MMFQKLKTLCLLLLLPTLSFAQGGGATNGGDVDEAYIFAVAKNIEVLLRSTQCRSQFPEVSPDVFEKTIGLTDIKVVRKPLKDKNQALRTAVNLRGESRNLIFFRSKEIERAARDQNGAGLVVLIFHEFLNLMGLELNNNQAVASIYPISKRIAPYADLILKGNVRALDSEKFGYALYASYSLATSLELQKQMLKENFFISDLNPLSPTLTKSKIDASLVCQICSGEARCAVFQTPTQPAQNRQQNYEKILEHSNEFNQYPVLNQQQQAQQQQQQQSQQQQQQAQQQQQQQSQQQAQQQQQQEVRMRSSHADDEFEALLEWIRSTLNGKPVAISPTVSTEMKDLLVLKKFKPESQKNRCQLISTQLTCLQNQKDMTCFSYR